MSIIEPYDTEGDFMIGLKRKLVEMVAFDLEPFCITERRGFAGLINHIDNRIKMPCRNTMTYTCLPDEYESVKRRVMLELSDAQNVALTSDG